MKQTHLTPPRSRGFHCLAALTACLLLSAEARAQTIQIIRQFGFEGATFTNGAPRTHPNCPNYIPDNLKPGGSDVFNPENNPGNHYQLVDNVRKGFDGQSWLANNGANVFGGTGTALAIKYPATNGHCAGQKMEYAITRTDYNYGGAPIYGTNLVRYTGFALKLGGAGHPFQSPVTNGYTGSTSPFCLVAQWHEVGTVGLQPAMAFYIEPIDGNKDHPSVKYRVEVKSGPQVKPAQFKNVIFSGTLAKDTWHRFVFATCFRPVQHNGNWGFVQFWINGVPVTVAANSGDQNTGNTANRWDGNCGYQGIANYGFKPCIYRGDAFAQTAFQINQTLFVDKLRITRSSDNLLNTVAKDAADPANW